MSHLIATCAPEAANVALDELRRQSRPVTLATWLDAGVALLSTPNPPALADALAAYPPVFVRHLAPADLVLPLSGHIDDIGMLTAVVRAALPAMLADQACDLGAPYAVQVRLSRQAAPPYTRYAVAEPLRALLARYSAEDVRHPQLILSVYCAPTQAYIGLWPSARCLSDWPGGEHRFARTPEQVSRAEFKLLEALAVWKLALPGQGHALDLGAAPGGWTRILVQAGLAAVAVDPADLDARVLRLPQVQHWRGYAADYIAHSTTLFDVLVNDMRMDARDSARLMVRAAACLRPGGLAIMTLKLPQAHGAAVYRQAHQVLAQAYTVVGARQLFHNRSEVTVVLRRAAG